jgi:two-component system CheB/CheR fusion protein
MEQHLPQLPDQSHEAAARRSEELLRATMESVSDFAIFTMDEKRTILSWNSGAESMFGYTADEIIGQSADVIFTEPDREAEVPRKEQEQADKEGRAMDERWHVRKDGSELFVSGVVVPMRSEILSGYVKVGRDITDRKTAEQLKDEFIAVASHELKTPVTSIKMYTDLLQESDASADRPGVVEKLKMQVSRLTRLVNNLLDVTTITEGQLGLELSRFDINELIADIAENLQTTTDKHKLVVRAEATKAVDADYERIGQVLTNIIANAIKYTPQGGDIIVSSTSDEHELTVCVEDPGIGIGKEDLEKVFDRYQRITNEKGAIYPGLGLGLFISRNIIAQHNGRMSVESETGKGSKFCFTLPY